MDILDRVGDRYGRDSGLVGARCGALAWTVGLVAGLAVWIIGWEDEEDASAEDVSAEDVPAADAEEPIEDVAAESSESEA